jgi:hypothetical protein
MEYELDFNVILEYSCYKKKENRTKSYNKNTILRLINKCMEIYNSLNQNYNERNCLYFVVYTH